MIERDPAFQQAVDARRQKRMAAIDAMPQPLRELVHEYGYTVVYSFMQLGVTKPKHIRHLVETVLNEFSPTRGTYSAQGVRGDANGADLVWGGRTGHMPMRAECGDNAPHIKSV